jgi:CheY-like chemotaxis protein
MEFAALVESTPAEGAEDPTPRRRGTILLVEDDDTLGAASAAILRGAGYRVHFAQNHQTALAVLAGSEPIDLLLTDVVMPAGLGGVALARIAHKHRPGIKVVYNTAYDIPGLNETGCDIVLHKPVDSEQLLSTVGRSIEASQLADKMH